jgi:hypothetical protein
MAKIIGFPGPSDPGGPQSHGNARARAAKAPKKPAWTSLVGLSPWWRLADCLVRACGEGPLKLEATGELPAALVAEAWALRDPECPLAADARASGDSESQFPSLVEVRGILEAEGILEATRRNIRLGTAGEAAHAEAWQLWPLLFDTLRRRLAQAPSRQPGAGRIFRQTLPSSLGYLLAASGQGIRGADRLLDLLEPQLELRAVFRAAGIELAAAPETLATPLAPGAAAPARPFLPYETDWFSQVVEGLAAPLGLALVSQGSRGHIGAWTARSALAVHSVEATALLEAL